MQQKMYIGSVFIQFLSLTIVHTLVSLSPLHLCSTYSEDVNADALPRLVGPSASHDVEAFHHVG